MAKKQTTMKPQQAHNSSRPETKDNESLNNGIRLDSPTYKRNQ